MKIIDLVETIKENKKVYKIYINSKQVFKSEDKNLFEQAKKIYTYKKEN